jgi:hypothetical protein
MSRGPGRIEVQIIELFRERRKTYFQTDDFCRAVYGIQHVAKKHRVSVLRALRRLSGKSNLDLWRVVLKGSRDDLWFDYNHWPHPSAPPPNGAPASGKRPRKRSRIIYGGRIYEKRRKR